MKPKTTKPEVVLKVTLSDGATTEMLFEYADDETALRAFGRFARYTGPGIMPMLGIIAPEELKSQVDPD